MQNLILSSARLSGAVAVNFWTMLFDPGTQASVSVSMLAAVVVSFAIALVSFLASGIISKVGTFLRTGVKKNDNQDKGNNS